MTRILAWAWAACLCVASVGSATEIVWPSPSAPSERLGLAFPGDNPRNYGQIAEAGIGLVRVSASWRRLEPEPGRFDFRGLDMRVLGLGRHGISSFLTFESNAAWAVRHADKVKNGTPRDLDRWRALIRAVVERYDGDGVDDAPGLRLPVRHWQVANEFMSAKNRSGGWAGTDDELIAYINAGYAAIKQADPSAIVVLGGLAAYNIDVALKYYRSAPFTVQQRWSESSKTVFDTAAFDNPAFIGPFRARLERVLRETRYDMADVHLYGPEDRDPARIDLIRSMAGRPVVSTECGGPSLDYGGGYSGQLHFRAVLKRNLIVWSSGVRYCLWFAISEGIRTTWGNQNVPLFDRAMRPKPGVRAYQLLSALLPELRSVERLDPDVYRLNLRNGAILVLFDAPRTGFGAADNSALTGLCVNDAEQGFVRRGEISELAQTCTKPGVLLAGDGLTAIFARKDR